MSHNLSKLLFELYQTGDLVIDGADRCHLTDAAVSVIAEHCREAGMPLGDCASRIERNITETTAYAILLMHHTGANARREAALS